MHRFTPSLLDRLIDVSPLKRSEPLCPTLSLEQLKDAIARDVESLLNARRGAVRGLLAGHPKVLASVAAFGLDDFVSMSLSSTVDRAAICRSIEHAITDHEPRLRHARVEFDKRDTATQKLRFSIRATLLAHPMHESVKFDAMLQTTTQRYAVQCGQRSA